MPQRHFHTRGGQAWTKTGLLVGGLPRWPLALDGAMKLGKPEFVVKATTEIGDPEDVIVPLGVVVLACALLYLFRVRRCWARIPLTGYLGGAAASHVRHADGWGAFLSPAVFGALLWGGLYLRDARLRTLVPFAADSGRQASSRSIHRVR